MVATTLAQQFGGTLQGRALEDINQQAQQMYTGNRAQQRLAMRGVSATSNDPNRWGSVSGNRWAGGTDVAPELANIPNDDGSFDPFKGQSTAGGQVFNQYYGKDNIYTDQGRNNYIKENILDKGWGDIGNGMDSIAGDLFNESDKILAQNSLGRFYNTNYGKTGEWTKLPTYAMPQGWTEQSRGGGKYEMFDPNGASQGFRYGSLDEAIGSFGKPVSAYEGANTNLRKAEVLSGLLASQQNLSKFGIDKLGLNTQPTWSNTNTAKAISDKYMQGLTAALDKMNSPQTTSTSSDPFLGIGPDSAYQTPTQTDPFASEASYLQSIQQPKVDLAHTKNHDAFGNNVTDTLSALYGAKNVYRDGKLAGYRGSFLDAPEESSWADEYKYKSGSNALTRKTTKGFDIGDSYLGAGYGNNYANYNLGNGQFFMTPEQAAQDANIKIYDQYRRDNQWETGPSLGMQIGKYGTMAAMAAMGGVGGAGAGAAATGGSVAGSGATAVGAGAGAGITGGSALGAAIGGGIGAAVPGAMQTGFNGNWKGALTGLGLGAVSGGLAGAISPTIQQGLGSMFGNSMSANTAQALARAGSGALTSAGTKGLSNLLQNNKFGQGMGEAAVQGSLAGLGSILAGSNASVGERQQMGSLASSAGKLGSALYKTSKTKKG